MRPKGYPVVQGRRKADVMGERDRNDAWEAAERERLAKELVETVVRMGYQPHDRLSEARQTPKRRRNCG